MLYYIAKYFVVDNKPLILNVFRYITFRTAMAGLTAFLVSLLFGPFIIRKLKEYQGTRIERKDVPDAVKKQKIPTMGGIIIIFSITAALFLWGNWSNHYIQILFFTMIFLGTLGWTDDFMKLKRKGPSGGLKSKTKLFFQVSWALIVSFLLIRLAPSGLETATTMLFFKDILINMFWLYPIFVIIVIVGSSNAVNLTDGLDGLAVGITLLTTIALAIITYIAGNTQISSYLYIPYIPNTGEISIVLGALFGASLGFLWFNAHPAEVFMGDTGSLMIGGVLGTIAVIIRQEFLWAILGFVFVLEAVSVIMQVSYFKFTKKRTGQGRRIFKMAPFHHHMILKLKEKGSERIENRVVMRLWIIAIIAILFGLATLKMR